MHLVHPRSNFLVTLLRCEIRFEEPVEIEIEKMHTHLYPSSTSFSSYMYPTFLCSDAWVGVDFSFYPSTKSKHLAKVNIINGWSFMMKKKTGIDLKDKLNTPSYVEPMIYFLFTFLPSEAAISSKKIASFFLTM